MTAIERTAYPRFRRGLTAEELAAVYTPTPEETAFATATARGEASVLSLLVLLKAFQRMRQNLDDGYCRQVPRAA